VVCGAHPSGAGSLARFCVQKGYKGVWSRLCSPCLLARASFAPLLLLLCSCFHPSSFMVMTLLIACPIRDSRLLGLEREGFLPIKEVSHWRLEKKGDVPLERELGLHLVPK
jgi:hypothetical protein